MRDQTDRSRVQTLSVPPATKPGHLPPYVLAEERRRFWAHVDDDVLDDEQFSRVDSRAEQRAAAAEARDRAAAERDRAATERDLLQEMADSEAPDATRNNAGGSDVDQVAHRELSALHRQRRREDRERAADDREAAASDRADAAADRLADAQRRDRVRAELRHAQHDPLTGAYGRRLGLTALSSSINRARRRNGRLTIACVDLDGLKEVNDSQGHAAGDVRLQDIFTATRMSLRSYDVVARMGGDEFLCILEDALPKDAQRRFREVQESVTLKQPGASFSVGFASLLPQDTLITLLERADEGLYEAKLRRATA